MCLRVLSDIVCICQSDLSPAELMHEREVTLRELGHARGPQPVQYPCLLYSSPPPYTIIIIILAPFLSPPSIGPIIIIKI